MGLFILLMFIGMPIAEIAVFIKVGGWLGLWPTVGMVVLTAVAGTALLRAQGLAVLRRAQDSLNRGEMPLAEVFDGFCLVAAGVLLLTPGFITDAMGMILLLPPARAALRVWAAAHLVANAAVFHASTAGPHATGRTKGGAVIIEGEFDEVDATDPSGGGKPPRIET